MADIERGNFSTFSNFTSFSIIFEQFPFILVGGGTPLSEARLEEKRRVLRRALKKEYMNQRYNPEMYPSGRRVFDTAFMRWSAIQNSSDVLVSEIMHDYIDSLTY